PIVETLADLIRETAFAHMFHQHKGITTTNVNSGSLFKLMSNIRRCLTVKFKFLGCVAHFFERLIVLFVNGFPSLPARCGWNNQDKTFGFIRYQILNFWSS